ncbi:class I SAM-dependent methyltransferase [Haliea sp. E17]|uniref:class I SAM-dependent methyltransferase n=1 Tax=Haliea sp. E17 TaxID=3401576 RepID=UPI003AAB1DFE
MANSSRTEHRFRGVRMPTASHPAIRRLKRQGYEPSIHGNKLWKSSALIIDYLKQNPPPDCRRVLDVGCGWGIAGIWCAKKLGAKVTSVDADPDVFPYLQAAADLNGVETTHLVSRFEKLSTKQLAKFDLMIAADVCFWDELVNPVTNLVNRAVKAGVKQILIADPERPPFFEIAERCAQKHCAEVVEWRTRGSVEASGAIMVLENA